MTATVQPDLQELDAALRREWHLCDSGAGVPATAAQAELFYRKSQTLLPYLEARDTDETEWTDAVVHVARTSRAECAVDVGCGTGRDLRALMHEAEVPHVTGVEPNTRLRARVNGYDIPCVARLADADLEEADLLLCHDVLEGVFDPESLLSEIASRARLGALFVENVATHRPGPLHLWRNRGWKVGRVLDRYGWEVVSARPNGIRVWERMHERTYQRAGILLCAYRGLSIPTMEAVFLLSTFGGWRLSPKHGDGLIDRARSIVASRWYTETADDVFLMIDDDFQFEPDAAELLVNTCRDKRSIVWAAYPVRDGSFLAGRLWPNHPVTFGPDSECVPIEYPATGFMAVHRDVLDAMIPTLQLCHGNEPWSFWPMFLPTLKAREDGVWWELSEDWAFAERARALGFEVWLDPRVHVSHLGQVPISVANMRTVARAIREDREAGD